jgi:hypothetical protein
MVISNSIGSCAEDEDDATYKAELSKNIASDIPPHKFALKPGACIILIKNLNISHGHCNVTGYIIKELTPRLIKAEKLCGGPHSEILIPHIPMISKDTDFLFENRCKNDINNGCLLSVDGTDFQRSQTNKDWYSHKFKRSGLCNEVAILILGGDICWSCGPWRPGVYNDLMIFCESLATWLEPGE